jgi:putative toxin-antitoxin system antitoxin component (TIGR02293 family)
MHAATSAGAAPAANRTSDPDFVSQEEETYRRSSKLLGGSRFVRSITSKLELHAFLIQGMPFGALVSLLDGLTIIEIDDVAAVLGVSTRTLNRHSETPKKAMPADLASKTWMLAETLAKASEIFGSKEAAEAWLKKPAMGLDGQRPIEMLQTLQGAELVDDFLGRLKYGVYT